jgi:hypothetical protein
VHCGGGWGVSGVLVGGGGLVGGKGVQGRWTNAAVAGAVFLERGIRQAGLGLAE